MQTLGPNAFIAYRRVQECAEGVDPQVNFIRVIEFLLTIAFIGIFIGPLVMSRAWVG